MKKLVRDLMHPGLHTCRAETTLGKVAALLTQHHVHALVVVGTAGNVLGIISDYDLLAGEWLAGDPQDLATMRQLTAGELMSSPVEGVEADLPLKTAAHKMVTLDINRLLVTEQGQPVGIISTSDFVSSIAREAPPLRRSVADVMSDAILVCRDKTPLASAARTMTQAGWRSVLVVNARGKPLGVVSGKDLLPYVVNGVDENLTVSSIMHSALTIDINASLQEAANLMIKKHYHRLIVADHKNPQAFPLGVISSYDIVAEMAKPDSIWQKK
jgi:CBS domain-containing protein